MELVSSDTKIDFLGKRYIAFIVSAIMIAASAYVWVDRGDSKFGIDYSGGHRLVVRVPSTVDSEQIRDSLKSGEITGAIVQAFGSASNAISGENEFSLRFTSVSPKKLKELREAQTRAERETTSDADLSRRAAEKLLQGTFDNKVQILSEEYVGPTIGAELQRKSLIAVIVGLIGILGYITYRFEFAFALGAVVALFHDVVVTMGLYLYLDFDISVATLAAALTIVGYSVNDTIIIFDRMREEVFKQQKFELVDLMNYSISRTLSRTVITSLLTLFSALALLLFGGGAIADLSLFLVVGVITGTYSTIFIASPVALGWENFRNPAGASTGASSSESDGSSKAA
jgi:preprotein translocase subunit SecF